MSKVVVKVGSNLLVNENHTLNKPYIAELCRKLAELVSKGHEVALITSGARAAGYSYLRSKQKNPDLYMKQALCAVGQVQLMKYYENIFDFYSIKVAQILLTRDTFTNRKRYLNLRNTLIGLSEIGALPVVNENDTVAVEEITLGDNDMLAAMFSIAWGADFLVLLSTVDGVLDEHGKVIERYENDMKLKKMKKSSWGTGGIETKLEAAVKASSAGVKTCICNGRHVESISRFVGGHDVGTVFEPKIDRIQAKKAWIGFLSEPSGKIWINEGAEDALKEKKSLLPVGITGVEGEFEAGDVVEIAGANGKIVGRGIVNFSSREIEKIKGIKSSRIKQVLGYDASKVVVHIDNMWLK